MKTYGFFAVAAFAVGATFAGEASAQERREPPRFTAGEYAFLPEIDVRLRGEYRNDPPDYETPQRANTWAMLTRARLGVAVERDFLRAKLTVQDARYVGNGQSPYPPRPAAFGPYEAYAEARSSEAEPSFVRIGRQAVEWGEGRLVGVADFSPTGRSLDAIRARAVLGDLQVEGLGVLLATPTFEDTFPGVAGDRTLSVSRSGAQLVGARVAYRIAPLLTVELFGFARYTNTQPPTLLSPYLGQFSRARAESDIYTGSLRISGRNDTLSYGVEGSVQAGNARLDVWQPVSAYAVAAHVERRFFGLRGSPTLRVLGGYASGGETGGKLRHFDPLLPDTQRWHGRFDLFGFSNLADVGGQVDLAPAPWITATAGYRYAHLANARGEWIGAYLTPIGTPTVGSGSLGHELSFGVSLEPVPGFTLAASYSALALGEGGKSALAARLLRDAVTLDPAVPADVTHYAFAEARVRFP